MGWVMCKEGKDGSIKLQRAEFKDSTIIRSVHVADISLQQLTMALGSLYGAHMYAPEVFCWIHDRRAWAQVGEPKTFILSPHEAGRCRAPGGTPDGDGGSKDFIPIRVTPLQTE